ncbi:hypothetical protein DIPPA_10423 [Diplonema papillatum]|nr:hypothetical protein DIPPA_10384 [Diplonema papillatum]KAJ9472015.1 hypothetical protein DIPPA_10393 [Diplonema papillatum]KAJ9472016.1 hypothetical protein DIPPA_10423 [Diplonema papillatum]
MDRVVLFSLERYGVKVSSRWGLGEAGKPLTRPEVAEAVLAGREHDVRMSPLQVVAVFRELTKSKVDGESAEVQWNARCTEALRYLCAKVSNPESVASAATGPECVFLSC